MFGNVDEARERMFEMFLVSFANNYGHRPTNICIYNIQFILFQNIHCWNTL